MPENAQRSFPEPIMDFDDGSKRARNGDCPGIVRLYAAAVCFDVIARLLARRLAHTITSAWGGKGGRGAHRGKNVTGSRVSVAEAMAEGSMALNARRGGRGTASVYRVMPGGKDGTGQWRRGECCRRQRRRISFRGRPHGGAVGVFFLCVRVREMMFMSVGASLIGRVGFI